MSFCFTTKEGEENPVFYIQGGSLCGHCFGHLRFESLSQNLE